MTRPFQRQLSAATLAASLLLPLVAGCGDSKARPNGDSCEEATECASGLCYENKCLDPEGDEDGDGLINRIEASIGSSSTSNDTDGDGKLDPDELDGGFVARDTDGDGKPDIIESAIKDSDKDCRPDENDPDDLSPDGNHPELIATTCPQAGVCVATGARLAVLCPKDLNTPVCDFSGVDGYEAPEIACDGRDNDCDGTPDAHCDTLLDGLVGHWRLDGDGQDSGPHGDHGTVVGATPAHDRFGNSGKAMRFANHGDHIAVPATEHPLGDATITYAAWVRPDLTPDPWADTNRGVFAFGEALTNNHRSSLLLSQGLNCAGWIGEANDALADRACAPGGHWTLLVVVKEGVNIRFFIDGRETDARAITAGHDLQTTNLLIGLTKLLDDGGVFEQFHGVIDDLRVWNRALTIEEIGRIHREGDWADAGSTARPGAHCLHVRDSAGVSSDGMQTLDVDGDGPSQPFPAWCDMTTEGGGWTLAWVYGFTNFDTFTDVSNAVTPVPSWDVGTPGVPVSKVPPGGPTAAGAIDFALWKRLGREFIARSDLTNDVICTQGGGSLSDLVSGNVPCRLLEEDDTACPPVAPTSLFLGYGGPGLAAATAAWYWDAATDDHWPTHDPCGTNEPNHLTNAAYRGGAIYLRPSREPMNWPGQCEGYRAQNRRNGNQTIDPDGRGGNPPFEAECLFGVDWGGWTRLSPDVLEAMEMRGAEPRQFLYKKNDRFYRSPVTTSVWREDGFAEAAGLWVWRGAAGAGTFVCEGGMVGETGVGCGPRAVTGADALPRVMPQATFNHDMGLGSVCQSPPNVFAAAGSACASDVEVWVRAQPCLPDEGSLLGDGGFDAIDMSGEWAESPCWQGYGPNNWFRDYALDYEDFPPGGTAPSLKATNTVVGNDIWRLNLLQQRISIIEGRSYKFSFWAKAAETRNMRVFVQPRTFDYPIFFEDLTVTPEWRRYELGFEARRTDWDVQLDFQMAEFSTASIWLDDVSLTDEGPTPCGPRGDGNILGNGDFSAGTTCWRHGQTSTSQVFSHFETRADGGPNNAPRAIISKLGAPVEAWRQNLVYRNVPLQTGRRYALSYDARGSVENRFYINFNRWDLGIEPALNKSTPVTPTWRNYRFDFVTTATVPADGMTMEIAFGEFPTGSVEMANIRLIDLGAAPCSIATGPRDDPGFQWGMACWFVSWHWDELALYGEIDTTEPGRPMRFEISQNASEFWHTARLEARNIQLEGGMNYILSFRTKADTAREGYFNINEYEENWFPVNMGINYYTTWQTYEIPFQFPRNSRPAGSILELGFGGNLATGRTWFDDVSLREVGTTACAPVGNNIVANGGFNAGRSCWDFYFSPQRVRASALSDQEDFGAAAPGLRVEGSPVANTYEVNLVQRGLTLPDGSYRLSFRARAASPRNLDVYVFDSDNAFLGKASPLLTTWSSHVADFTVSGARVGDIRIEFQAGSPGGETIWLDDISLVPNP